MVLVGSRYFEPYRKVLMWSLEKGGNFINTGRGLFGHFIKWVSGPYRKRMLIFGGRGDIVLARKK